MRRLVTLLAVFGQNLFAGFLQSRLLAELPGADELVRRPTDHRSDDPRTGRAIPVVGVT